MLYPELFRSLEEARWSLSADVPWASFDPALLTDEQALVLMEELQAVRFPTNLHVNRALFPNDTVQGRLPDPGWLDRWLDEPIRSVRELSRYRKAHAVAA